MGPSSSVLADQPGNIAGDLFSDFSLDGFGSASAGVSDSDPVSASASYERVPGEPDQIQVSVDIQLSPTWHVYSTTQPAGGPLPTKLTIAEPEGISITKPFRGDREPLRSVSAEFGGITVEEFDSKVTFTARARIPAGQTAADLGPITVKLDALACTTGGACLPVDESLTANYTGEDDADSRTKTWNPTIAGTDAAGDLPSVDDIMASIAAGRGRTAVDASTNELSGFRDADYPVLWSAQLDRATAAPGETVGLTFTATPDVTFHVYTAATNDADSKTNFVVTDKTDLQLGPPQTESEVVDYDLLPGVTYHHGAVTWTIPVRVPDDATPGVRSLRGGIAYQACQDTSCQVPMALSFEADLSVVSTSATSGVPAAVELKAAKRIDVLDSAATIAWVDVLGESSGVVEPQPNVEPTTEGSWAAVTAWLFGSFPGTLIMAFIGGVILNFMPCVLPVVGLKVMSFVEQAGEQRGRVLALNLVYSFGILAVFAVLATLAIVFSFSWGEQFTFVEFRLGLTVLLFALALSYLGVWEIPAPSFASGATSQRLGNQEGYVGAFFKGVFATLLATPCSGPLLGFILGATINLSPVQTVAVMMTVGIGMALPYLIIGVRPGLVSWLPKPGPWMETLKEFLAFLFLGTVAFFFYGFADEHKVPVFVTLIGVWFGCWIIGKVPNWAAIQKRVSAWLAGVGAATAIGLLAFRMLVPGEHLINWQPYSEANLTSLQREGKTVILDFTADWCVNCKVNEKLALNTKPTQQLLEQLDAVAMVADWSNRENAEIKDKLKELQSRSIPVLAIYPGSQPDQPIILRDLVTQSAVLDALNRAGPSVSRRPDAALVSTTTATTLASP
ncbi:MAG: thioredoxin family protein [Planctomycetota bacterium]